MSVIIVCPTQKRGLQYCEDHGIPTGKGTSLIYGQRGRGRIFTKDDDVRFVDLEHVKRRVIEALIPCFLEVGLPRELEEAYAWNTLKFGEGRVIVCGGRTYRDGKRIHAVLEEYAKHDPVIVTGSARGADRLALRAAYDLGLRHEEYVANWERYGRGAGPRRNEEMAKAGAVLCIAFTGGAGTRDMVRRARAHGIPVREEL